MAQLTVSAGQSKGTIRRQLFGHFSEHASEAEVVVQLKMSVTASDCREYFNRNIGTNDSKINTISLCTAVPYINPDGILEYADIRPFTRFNFPNEALIDYSKGIDITYYLYY